MNCNHPNTIGVDGRTLCGRCGIEMPKPSRARPYLAGSIMGCTDAEAHDWRREALAIWPRALNPMDRDYRGSEDDDYREIVDLDKRDIAACDAVLVHHDKPSVGTAMEVLLAWQLGKPVVVLHLRGPVSPWMRYHSTAIVRTWEDAIEKLKMIMDQ